MFAKLRHHCRTGALLPLGIDYALTVSVAASTNLQQKRVFLVKLVLGTKKERAYIRVSSRVNSLLSIRTFSPLPPVGQRNADDMGAVPYPRTMRHENSPNGDFSVAPASVRPKP